MRSRSRPAKRLSVAGGGPSTASPEGGAGSENPLITTPSRICCGPSPRHRQAGAAATTGEASVTARTAVVAATTAGFWGSYLGQVPSVPVTGDGEVALGVASARRHDPAVRPECNVHWVATTEVV